MMQKAFPIGVFLARGRRWLPRARYERTMCIVAPTARRGLLATGLSSIALAVLGGGAAPQTPAGAACA